MGDFSEELQPLFDSLNPLAFLTNDETKSMEEEVENFLSLEEENNQKAPKQGNILVVCSTLFAEVGAAIQFLKLLPLLA